MKQRHAKITRWVRRGQYAVELQVDVTYPDEDSTTPCLEPATIKLLDEVAHRAEIGDVSYLRRIGRVYQALTA